MTSTDELRQDLFKTAGVVGATITLRGGGYIDFLDPKPEMIRATDIASGLAKTCRFGGQCETFYSVAEHSILVATMLPPELKFAGLMHDAAEAYIGDMVGPLKRLCPDFKAVELRIEAGIAAKFGITEQLHDPRIKHADLRALRTEQLGLSANAGDSWSGLDEFQPWDGRLMLMDPFLAEQAWLTGFRRWSPL